MPMSPQISLRQPETTWAGVVTVEGAGAGGDDTQAAYAVHDSQKDGALEHMDGALAQRASGNVEQYEKATHTA